MAKRLPRPRLLRGLLKNGLITDKKEIALIERKMKSPKVQYALNDYYTQNKGHRWIERLRIWGKWLVQHQDAIFQILGIVVLFADDGKRVLVDGEASNFEQEKARITGVTPDGEKVEDFTEPKLSEEDAEKAAEAYGIGIDTPVVGPAYPVVGDVDPIVDPLGFVAGVPTIDLPEDDVEPEDESSDEEWEWFDIDDEWDDDPSEEVAE